MSTLIISIRIADANFRFTCKPGDEGIWFKENMAYFKEQADVHDNEDIRDMLKELGEREDLKKLLE